MNLNLIIMALTGIVVVSVLIVVPIILIWWLIKIRKIRKAIPEELKKSIENLKGGEYEKEIEKKAQDSARRAGEFKRENKADRTSKDNSNSQG